MKAPEADLAAVAGRLLSVPAEERNALLEREGESPASFGTRVLAYLSDTPVPPSDAERLAAAARDLARGDPRLAASLERARGHALRRLARFADAESAYRRALASFVDAGDRTEAARTEIGLVDALMYQGHYDDALATAEHARATFEETGDSLRVARILTNAGNIYHRTDRYDEALDHYGRARAIFESIGDAPAIALVDFNRANILASRLRFAEAEEAYERAVEHFKGAGRAPEAAQIEYNLAYLYFLRGNHAESLRRFALVEPAFTALGDRRHLALLGLDRCEIFLEYNLFAQVLSLAPPAQATFLDLGMRYEAAKCLAYAGLAAARLGRFDEALGFEKRAFALFTAERNEVWQAVVHLHAAALLQSRALWDDAAREASAALERFRRHRLPAREAQALLVVSAIAARAGRADEAERARALARERAAPLGMPALVSRIDHLEGAAAEETGDREAALAAYRRAVRGLEKVRSALRVEEMQTQFLADREEAYFDLARLLSSDDRSVEELFDVLEAVRSRGLAERMVGEVGRPRTAAGERLAARLRDAREELTGFQRAAMEAELRGAPDDTRRRLHDGAREGERALADLRLQLESLEGEAPEALGSGARPVPLKEVRRHLPPGTVLLEYACLGERVIALVIDHDSIRRADLPMTASEVRRIAGTLRFHWDKFLYGSTYLERHGTKLLEATNAALRSLHAGLAEGLVPAWADRVVVVPHGPLHDLPFHAFEEGEGPLIRRAEVVYAPSATVLVRSLDRGSGRGAGALCAGVADDHAPHVAAELREIAERWPGALLLAGPDATWERFAREAGAKELIHVASHAVFRQDNPLFSAIRFADGAWVSLFDVYQLRLNAALVVLSACDSGAARRDGGDELMGLLRGFLAAGAGAVVASQWPVHDESARAFMNSFHEALASGGGAPAALRTAMLQVRASRAHPYYWAPFKAIGSWSPVESSVIARTAPGVG